MSEETVIACWLTSIEAEQAAGLATVLPTFTANRDDLQTQKIFINKFETVGKYGNIELEKQVIEAIREKLSEKIPKPETRTFLLETREEINVFLDVYTPPTEIMIFGAGHDAIPLAANCISLGYRTTVVDARAAYNNAERFPSAKRIIANDADLHQLLITDCTYIIVMNHHIEKDEQILSFVLKSASPYVGVLGPRSRRMKMFQRLKDDGIDFTKEELNKMHSPVGLDIGARSPEEIAISITAEIIALKNDHAAGFLNDSETIHK